MKILLDIAAFVAALAAEAPAPQPFAEFSPSMRELISRLEKDNIDMCDVDFDAVTLEELDAAVSYGYKCMEAREQNRKMCCNFAGEKAVAITERQFC